MDAEEFKRRYFAGERDFRNVEISKLDWRISLEGGNFSGASLVRAYFENGIVDCNFEGATLEGAEILGIVNTNLRGANLSHCCFDREGLIEDCKMDGCNLKQVSFLGEFSIMKTILQNTNWEGITKEGGELTLSEVDLTGAINFINPSFGGFNISDSILPDGVTRVEWWAGTAANFMELYH
jgi:uncharacterized protein YjbI with pentapeptide repeats